MPLLSARNLYCVFPIDLVGYLYNQYNIVLI